MLKLYALVILIIAAFDGFILANVVLSMTNRLRNEKIISADASTGVYSFQKTKRLSMQIAMAVVILLEKNFQTHLPME